VTTLAWIVGAGGLLGSHVLRAAESNPSFRCFAPPGGRLPWGDAERLDAAFAAATAAFLRAAGDGAGSDWAILWCAGGGVVASPPQELAADRRAWEGFLTTLGAALDAGPRLEGRLLLASSAGGVWGGSTERPITESTPPRPLAGYGEMHLGRERALAAFVARRPGVRAVVARLSNLYGPGQRFDKPQGLISHVSRSVLLRRPVHLYVPLDTLRDYFFAEDAGFALVAALGAATGGIPGLRLVASEEPTSIAELLAVFHRVTRRRVAVVSGLHSAAPLQPRHLTFRSTAGGRSDGRRRTPLLEGIARVHGHHLALLGQGRLSAPPLAG
jgi:UDP-glucose 4-epimerase